MDDDRGRSEADYLRRYTSLPVLIDMLAERRLTLVDPGQWSDKNDTAYLAAYKEAKKLKCLVALCFTATSETFHHWNVFSPGPGGVCDVPPPAVPLAMLDLQPLVVPGAEAF